VALIKQGDWRAQDDGNSLHWVIVLGSVHLV